MCRALHRPVRPPHRRLPTPGAGGQERRELPCPPDQERDPACEAHQHPSSVVLPVRGAPGCPSDAREPPAPRRRKRAVVYSAFLHRLLQSYAEPLGFPRSHGWHDHLVFVLLGFCSPRLRRRPPGSQAAPIFSGSNHDAPGASTRKTFLAAFRGAARCVMRPLLFKSCSKHILPSIR